ncbi:MAG: ATP-binding protein [Clostridium fessum]
MSLRLFWKPWWENAIKYNREEGKVWVTLDADHKFFYVKVEDNGVGILKEFQERVFERFYRVDKAALTRDRRYLGWGLRSRRILFFFIRARSA